ncbi:hypothetical protein NW94_03475 [Burkholderia mallei]|nr:hypothetical protein DM57_15510 [Burkholderia mallei]ATD88074.1 hypothetical protein NM78_03160 [Burkholderia mallei]ATD92834.1 hypothetical protein NW91_03160 [Burkholderia mallei]ATD97642.1 hypothetical protein NW92_03490 [Burkholderia mallei]ATE02551.1 hypothetical protein NW93_03775 [Burkholderia mallei]
MARLQELVLEQDGMRAGNAGNWNATNMCVEAFHDQLCLADGAGCGFAFFRPLLDKGGEVAR